MTSSVFSLRRRGRVDVMDDVLATSSSGIGMAAVSILLSTATPAGGAEVVLSMAAGSMFSVSVAPLGWNTPLTLHVSEGGVTCMKVNEETT